MKKILAFINIIFLITSLIYAGNILSKEIKEIKKLNKNKSEFSFFNGSISNKWNFNDELINVSIKNIFAVKREVYIYQWIESENKLNKDGIVNYSYSKKWANSFIDSNKFKDKTKNNHVRNIPYKNAIFVPYKATIENKYDIDQKYFINKIDYEIHNFKKNIVFIGAKLDIQHNFDFKDSSITEENYADLDAYVSSIEKKVASTRFDKFKIINEQILYNGRNYNSPEIGDIKIIYKTFSPNLISFMGTKINNQIIPYKDFYIVEFNGNTKNKMIFKYKLIFMTQVFLFINFAIFAITIIINNLKHTLKKFTLKFIYYFGECIVYSKKEYLTSYFLAFTIGIVSGFYIITILALLALLILRQFDYFSI